MCRGRLGGARLHKLSASQQQARGGRGSTAGSAGSVCATAHFPCFLRHRRSDTPHPSLSSCAIPQPARKPRAKNNSDWRPLTQQELLAEAALNEIENTR